MGRLIGFFQKVRLTAAVTPSASPPVGGAAPSQSPPSPPPAVTSPPAPAAGTMSPAAFNSPPPAAAVPPTATQPPPSTAPSVSSPPAPPPANSAPPPVLSPPPTSPPPAQSPPAPPPVFSPPPASPPPNAPPPAILSPPPAAAPPPQSPPPQSPPPAAPPLAPPPSSPLPSAPPPFQPPSSPNAPPPSQPPSSPNAPPPSVPPPNAPPPNAPPPNSLPPPNAPPPQAPPPSGNSPPPDAPPPKARPPKHAPPPKNSATPPSVAPSTPPSVAPVVSPPGPTPPGFAPATIPRIDSPNLYTPPPPVGSGPVAAVPGPQASASGVPNVALIVGAAGGVGALVFLVCFFVFCCRKKKRKGINDDGFSYKGSSIATMPLTGAQYKSSDAPDSWGMHSGSTNGDIPPPPSGSDKMGNSRSYFTYNELAVATDNFSKDNLLGEGGFGRVYKGLLPNGTVVAVKQLTVGGGQGEREFRAEVEVISRVHHRHLVSLVGYCMADKQRLLVYEFVPNGTLENNLHNTDMPIMEWSTRLKIGLGCARGLAYLHEDCHPKIIHRDIKSSNILLEENFEAQVADFGLAKLSSDTNTHVSTRVMGTFGYLAPEYAASGKLTDRSDVFSFGVVLLELVTGRRPIDMSQEAGFESLVEWARPVVNRILEDGHLEDLVDPNLNGDYDRDEMMRVIETAAACVRHSALKRPRMAQVVRALESDSDRGLLYQGMKPGQRLEDQSEYGSDYGGINRYTGDSGEFDDYSNNSGLRSFHKPNTYASRQGNNLSSIQSAEHSAIAEEEDSVDDLMDFNEGPSKPAPFSAFRPPALASQQFSLPRSGEYNPDTESSDFLGAYRKKSPPSYASPSFLTPRPANIGMSGFMGGPPPPPPGRYTPTNLSGEVDYVPIGKTVSFAPTVDEKKF